MQAGLLESTGSESEGSPGNDIILRFLQIEVQEEILKSLLKLFQGNVIVFINDRVVPVNAQESAIFKIIFALLAKNVLVSRLLLKVK